METPIVKLTPQESKTVYEPSEDSFLLIDALEKDLHSLKKVSPAICLEIGSGSGVVITALSMALKSSGFFLACDINPKACEVTKKTSLENNTNVEVLQMDLATCLKCRRIFDVIVFNPPYVVTESVELFEEDLIFKSWAGGKNGREIMEKIFKDVPNLLSEEGVFYLLVIKENDPDYVMKCFKKLGMDGVIVKQRQIRGEHLHILRFTKSEKRNCT